jgi:hypothetical protein
LDLTHSEDEMVRESAGLLRQRMEKFWQSSQGFKKLQAIAAAEADGFIKPGDRTDQGRVASGLADHQYTQLKTDAASKGVDFENEVAARVSGGHETGPDGLAPVSLARLRHAIEAEAEIKRRAVPDGKIRLPLTFIERDGEKIPVGSYEAKGDVLRDATVRALLEKQGVDMTPTPTDADEYNRLPAGARYRHPDGSIRVKQGVDMNPPKPAPARPADRKAGEVYQTPKGIYRWNGSGWETP